MPYCLFLGLILIAGVLLLIASETVFSPPPKPEETTWPATLSLISRGTWAPEAIAKPDSISPMNGIKRVTIHHDGLPKLPMATESQIKSRIISIRNSHSTKYADIGYHFIIDPLGRVWEGRPIKYQGAHARGENSNNVGVLFLGNTSEEKPTKKGLNGLYTLVRYLMQRYEVNADKIYTHGELGQTECPGKYLQAEIDKARKRGEFVLPKSKSPGFDWRSSADKGMEFLRKVKREVDSLSS